MAQASNTQRRAQMQRRAASQRRTATPRRTPTTATPRFSGRRKPQQSGAQKLFGTLSSALPIGGGTSKVKRSRAGKSGPPKGLLALAVPAGLAAFKNRDKLRSKLPGQSSPKADVVVPVTEPAPVAHNSGAPAS